MRTIKSNYVANKNLSLYLWCLSFLKPIKGSVAILIVCGIITATSELYIPIVIQKLIEETIPSRRLTAVFYTLSTVVLLYLLRFMFESFSQYYKKIIQEKAASNIQITMINHLNLLGLPYLEKNPSGKILSLLNTEVTALQKLYRYYFPELVRSVIFGVIAIYLMVKINFYLSLIILPSFLLYYLVGPTLDKKANSTSKLYASSQLTLGQSIHEYVNGIKDIRGSNANQWSSKRMIKDVLENNDYNSKRYLYSFLRGSVRRFNYNLGAIALFIIGVYLIREGDITVGAFVAFLLIYFNTMWRLTRIITILTEQSILMNQAQNIHSFLQTRPSVTDMELSTKLPTGALILTNVSFKYNERYVLENINLTIKPGEKIAIVGESGSGKSTFLKLLTRLYDPTEGTISLDHLPFNQFKISDLRSEIGVVFQDSFMFASSIFENIRFAKPEATIEEVIHAAKYAHIHNHIMNLPNGYDTILGDQGSNLSGGQKQRIALARIFLKSPSIIILDEPTSSLDTVSELEIRRSIKQKFNNKTIITIAHRLNTIQDYDRIIVLNKGTIAEEGTFDQLLANKKLFYQMLDYHEKVVMNNG
ncbi:ABC transporter ATP-binding protein [Bacillus sp. E(2018)]|uniref:ABC transporter ATP-binding protein n=1 Tax=Bacillus sp. E(2018) TaxID=2502239 RepID=UPI0010F5E5EF|nr:ABC transporter ATP-binding protein [Bacillus sp. E(2018)]